MFQLYSLTLTLYLKIQAIDSNETYILCTVNKIENIIEDCVKETAI